MPLPFYFVVEETVVEAPEQTAAEVQAAPQHSPIDLILGSGFVVQSVLIALVIMSVVTWGIVFTKFFHFKKAREQNKKFMDFFFKSKSLSQMNDTAKGLPLSPVGATFCAGFEELSDMNKAVKNKVVQNLSEAGDIETVDRALKRAKAEEIIKLEKGTTFLATTASAAPFIGLFGTVWGIMNAFIGLSQVKSSSIQAVAPGISEALIATAIGLAAAIPAAIFYNFFSQEIRLMGRNIDMLSAEFLNMARKHFLR